ncbi:MAG: creatininase family protein, partial [Tissierellia bacterium]|nr:creatininase family protein [Tissierellia bacterium]
GEKMLDCVTDYLVELIEELEKSDWNYDYRKK